MLSTILNDAENTRLSCSGGIMIYMVFNLFCSMSPPEGGSKDSMKVSQSSNMSCPSVQELHGIAAQGLFYAGL